MHGISEIVSSGTEWLKLLAKVSLKRLALSKQVAATVLPLERVGMEHSFEFNRLIFFQNSLVLFGNSSEKNFCFSSVSMETTLLRNCLNLVKSLSFPLL